jgi:hypothetical protein
VLGTLTAINGNAMTVKADSGAETNFTITPATVLKRIAPGQKDLNASVAMAIDELAQGDRVLVTLDASTAPAQALRIIAIKAEDVEQKRRRESEEWQKNGTGGLVKAVDAAAGSVQITSGAGSTQKTVTIHVTAATAIKRYAEDSVSFEKAVPAPLTAIHPGDQLRARGAKNADGSEMTADELVFGTFLNLSGKLDVVDAASGTLTLKDLATKKTVTIHVSSDAQMRRIPEQMAQMIAMQLKNNAQGANGSAGVEHQSQDGQHARSGGNGNGGGLQALLNRAPQIHLGDLKKGDVVMAVASGEDGHINLITLLAGVEALLEAPASRDMLSNWSVGGGSEAAGGTQ